MCGIAGIYNFLTKEPVDSNLLQRMSGLIAHRGPDDSGIYLDGHLGLAHRRLAIIDLSPSGHQPLSNHDGTLWITYNGECYNYQDHYPQLRHLGYPFKSNSDTEVILNLYAEFGLDFLEKLDGMFAFALWDAKRQRLVLARDRLGIKPLFYYLDGKRLLFASELKALLADTYVPRNLNYGALGDFFQYLSIPDPESIFQGIKKLLPGSYLVVEDGQAKLHRYWDLEIPRSPSKISIDQAREGFIQHFQQAVISHMIADVPVGAFLSGGVDSSAVVAFASLNQENARLLNTFSITFKGSDEFDESIFAAQVARQYRTEHREFNLTPDLITALPKIVWHADEPFAISSAFALYFLSELTSKHTKVVMSGDGGDEVFAGYPWRHWTEPRFPAWLLNPLLSGMNRLGLDKMPAARDLYRRGRNILARSTFPPSTVYGQTLTCFTSAELSALLTQDAWQMIRDAKREDVINQYYNQPKTATALTRKLYTDVKTTLVSEMLTKVDRMTMAFGLEARVPLLDHHLVEWAFQLPDGHKLRGFEGKFVVKKAMERYLPRGLIYRTKHGFNVPMRDWLRGQLQEMTRDMFSSGRIRERGLLQPEAVQRIVNDHFEEGRDYSNQIFALMVLELWFQQYMDRPATEGEWQRS